MNFTERAKYIEAVSLQWIDDPVLKSILSSNIAYIQYLMHVADAQNTDVVLRRLLHRDITVHIGSVVEALIMYALMVYNKAGILQLKTRRKQYAVRHIISSVNLDGDDVLAVVSEKAYQLTDNMQFVDINRIALRNSILTKKLFEYAELIREERNKIHSKSRYTIHDIKETYTYARKIKKRIQEIIIGKLSVES